jgi:hypothetical protein
LRGAPLGSFDGDAGGGLDIKFGNALALELDSGETVLVQFFQPPRKVRRHHWLAGDLLALTSRRLLWITDRERGFYSRYGSIASYAPLDVVAGLEAEQGSDILQVKLKDASPWQIPISAARRGVAEEFAATLHGNAVERRRAEGALHGRSAHEEAPTYSRSFDRDRF